MNEKTFSPVAGVIFAMVAGKRLRGLRA